MKIYVVERTDQVGWDEYDSFVVVAKDEEQALDIVLTSNYDGGPPDCWIRDLVKVSEVDLSGAGIVLGSFNAG